MVDTVLSLTDDNTPIVADICRRLDGIPLAIELAAARVKVLSIPNLAQRLNERFKILTGGSRTALPRQKTLSALIDWSYDLLTPQEQMLFTRVAIFAGGFSLDAATAVCGGEGLDEIEVLDLLSSLTDKSLVVADTAGEQERYHLLESTRAYALEKLGAAGERERLARSHGEYFRDQAQEADKRYGIGSTAAWFATVELELDNYRAVLEWALTEGHDVVLGGAVAGALADLWLRGGLTVEGRYWISRAQASLDESAYPHVAARLWRSLGEISDGKRMHDCGERALALYQSVGDGHGAAWALFILAFSLFQMGRFEESAEPIARALAAMRECGDKPGVAACLSRSASDHQARGDIVAGRESSAQALAAYKALGNEARQHPSCWEISRSWSSQTGMLNRRCAWWARPERLTHAERTRCTWQLAITTPLHIALLWATVHGAREAACEGLRWARQAQNAIQHRDRVAAFGSARGAARRSAQCGASSSASSMCNTKKAGHSVSPPRSGATRSSWPRCASI